MSALAAAGSAAPASAGAPAGFAKAELKIDGGPILKCYFNPTEYSVSKANTWNYKEITGKSFAPPTFGGGQPRQMELSLLFDQTFPTDPAPMSVKDSTAALLDAMEVPKGKAAGSPTAAPPFITFNWGGLVFKAACTSLTVTYKLFTTTGEPLRADVKLTLKQADERARRVRTRPPARTPASACTACATATRCRRSPMRPTATPRTGALIAEANDVDNPLHLRRGTSLSLPKLEG